MSSLGDTGVVPTRGCKPYNHLFFNKATAQPETDARVRVFSAGLLTRRQFALWGNSRCFL
jgi:hypothetical protein